MPRDDDDRPRRFEYKRSEGRGKVLKERAAGKGGGYDNPFKSEYPVFLPRENKDYRGRIMPPTWEGADDYAFDVFIHYGIGVDNGRFLCPKKMYGKECVICDEYERAKRKGDDEYAQKIRASQASAVWWIDRDDEQAGPQIFPMPFTLDKEIALRSTNRRTQEIKYVDDPEKGFDIQFTRQKGKGKRIEYVNVEIDQKPSPLCDSEKRQARWLEYIADNPLPDTVLLRKAEYIEKVFAGGKKEDDDDDDRSSRRTRTRHDDDDDAPRRRSRDDDDEAPRSSRRRDKDPDEDEDDKPKRRSRDDDDEDQPRRRGKSQEIDDPDEDLDEDKPRKRKAQDDDEDEAPPRRKRSSDDDDEEPKRRSRDDDDDDVKPAKKRSRDDDEEEPPRRKRSDDDDDDVRPAKRRVQADDDDDVRPAKRRSRDDDDEDVVPAKKKRQADPDDEEDDPKPLRKRSRDDDD
jgi:hypothetical protein